MDDDWGYPYFRKPSFHVVKDLTGIIAIKSWLASSCFVRNFFRTACVSSRFIPVFVQEEVASVKVGSYTWGIGLSAQTVQCSYDQFGDLYIFADVN